MITAAISKELNKYASQEKAKILQRFFKTGQGEYGEGDIFIGVKVPEIRKVAAKFRDTGIESVENLIKSPVHEERLLALIILVEKYKKGNDREAVVKFYLKKTKYINNWDLIDLSAPGVLGNYLLEKKEKRNILYELAASRVLWERRISIISTLQFIRNLEFNDTIKIARILLKDEEDLIQKAVGWMLREIGKRDQEKEEAFLRNTYMDMPRTMLRYAIEKFPEKKRQAYLKGKI